MARPDEVKWAERDDLKLLNTDIPRVDGPHKVSGRAKYSHDIRLPGMLYGRALLCPHPAAKVKVDLSGVSVPGKHVAIVVTDGLRDGVETRWLGQPVAAVAAENPDLAEDALRQIRVDYEEVPWAVTPEQSLAEGAPQIGQNGNKLRPGSRGEEEEANAAFGECDAVVEAEYRLPVQHHACLETHGVVVDYRGEDGATIYASTQATHNISGAAAKELGLEANKVVTIVEHMGGGFGSKFTLDIPGKIACQLAKKAERPVHLMFTRKDEFLAGGNRSASAQKLKGGATKDGRFVTLVSDLTKLGGMGGGSNPGQPYIYKTEQRFTKWVSVLTNTDGSRAMRAPGHPQASFAIESMVDELAAAIAMDPLEFRKKNLEDPVYHRQLDRVAKEIGWHDHPHKIGAPESVGDVAVGIGFGVSTWGGGGRPSSKVDVTIQNDGSVNAEVGSQDLGTGTRTYLAAIVAEELGIGIDQVHERIGDSRLGMSVGSGGSVTTASLAPAVKTAAHAAREKLFTHLAPLLEADAANLVAANGRIEDKTDASRSMGWTEACGTLGASRIEAQGEWDRSLQASGVHGAQAAKVEVDTLTGEVRVLKMVCIQDCGLPLNRLALRSQINGGMIEALSYGMFEERIIDPWLGVALNPSFESYKLAGSMDMPEFVAIVDDDDDRHQVIGMAEPTVIPGQSAIACAIYNACGVRLRETPFTRDRVLRGLGKLG